MTADVNKASAALAEVEGEVARLKSKLYAKFGGVRSFFLVTFSIGVARACALAASSHANVLVAWVGCCSDNVHGLLQQAASGC